MKTKLFETKRRATSGGFRFLHVQTRPKKKQHVAAAASNSEFAVEEPNLGVARALVVILLLHLVAIGAIVVHNHSTKKDVVITDKALVPKEKTVAEVKPQLEIGDEPYFVQSGDTYERIASKHGLDSDYLRRLNDYAPLTSGLALKMPASVEPVQLDSADPTEDFAMAELPPIQEIAPSLVAAQYEVVAESVPVDAPAPQMLGPQVATEPQALEVEPVRAEVAPVVEQPKPAPKAVKKEVKVAQKPKPAAARTHKLKNGETIWSLSRRYGVSQEALMSANGIKDARKMRVGMALKIPSN